MAGDEDGLRPPVSFPPYTGHHQPLVATELALDPARAAAPREVPRAEALGDDTLKPEFRDP
jgi:hypothetical protein